MQKLLPSLKECFMDAYGGFIFTCSGEDEKETLTRYIRNYHSCSVTMNNPELHLQKLSLEDIDNAKIFNIP